MRVYTRIVLDIESGCIIEVDCYDHHGSVAECKGGGGGGTSTTTSGLPAWLEPYAKTFINSYYQQAFGQPFQEGATPSPIARPAGPPSPGRFIRMPATTAQRMGLQTVG